MKIPLIQIKYSVEIDYMRVSNTLKKMDWYIEHDYARNIILPAKLLPLDKNTTIPSNEAILSAVKDEYVESDYLQYACTIKSEFETYITKLDRDLLPIKLQPEYNLVLTKYGTGGSYTPPNIITINILKQKSGLNTLLHEMIHLSIETTVKKHNITQTEKERMVDLLFKKVFPDRLFEQKKYIQYSNIDTAFNSAFPDIEKICIEINKIPRV